MITICNSRGLPVCVLHLLNELRLSVHLCGRTQLRKTRPRQKVRPKNSAKNSGRIPSTAAILRNALFSLVIAFHFTAYQRPQSSGTILCKLSFQRLHHRGNFNLTEPSLFSPHDFLMQRRASAVIVNQKFLIELFTRAQTRDIDFDVPFPVSITLRPESSIMRRATSKIFIGLPILSTKTSPPVV